MRRSKPITGQSNIGEFAAGAAPNLAITIDPIKPVTLANRDPEFVRVPQLYPLAGLKRGLVYRKIADGTFKSVLLREEGNKSGCRLVFWPSVKAYLHRLMSQQGAAESDNGQESTVL